jgi:2,4-dienoyl-CoA reductase [(3E)-enoyl-CoA-producing], peroxisomal
LTSTPPSLLQPRAGAAGNFLSPLSQLSANAFKSVIDIDVLGSYNTTKAVLPHLVESAHKNKSPSSSSSSSSTPQTSPGGGRIIFVSATIHYTGAPLQTHVVVAKAGVDALSANVAIEYGPLGLTSNVVAPGPIGGTEGMDRLSRSEDVEASKRRIPSGRLGTVKEIADATVWLFSDAANYVNGETVVVDGGAWRTTNAGGGGGGTGFQYPDFLLSGDLVEGVKGMKKDKAKL